nr:hypothetical protein MACL_00000358 [Theileria orientalis]
MVSIGLNVTSVFVSLVFFTIYTSFFLHISCVSTSLNQKSKEQSKQSSKFMPYTQPYYNQAFFNQQYPYSTPDYYTNFDSKNMTIEVLPNDDEDEDDGYLKFGLLRDAYGYGDSIQVLYETSHRIESPFILGGTAHSIHSSLKPRPGKMELNSTLYNCNYTTNIYTKSKKWNTGFLRAKSNHGSVTLTLYEADENTNSCGKVIDRFDVFNAKTTALSGREFITGRNLIDVQDFVGQKYSKPAGEAHVSKPKIRAGLQRPYKSNVTPYKRPQKCSDVAIKPSPLPSFNPTFEPKPNNVFRPEHDLPTSNVNVSEIIKNIELMLDEN